ncbi:hypothetical protein, partial [Comamonas sp. BIGb0124]|uniref:hypothetical protein n=1 Tax=Comamonas sp. BIGb0124 TaxID=2485130 RepID=UPI001F307506
DSAGSRVKVGHRQALINKPPNPSKGWAFCFGKTKNHPTNACRIPSRRFCLGLAGYLVDHRVVKAND